MQFKNRARNSGQGGPDLQLQAEVDRARDGSSLGILNTVDPRLSLCCALGGNLGSEQMQNQTVGSVP